MLESLQGEFLLHLIIDVRVSCVLILQQAVPAVLSQSARLDQDDYNQLVVLCWYMYKIKSKIVKKGQPFSNLGLGLGSDYVC